ncbi:MAG: thrombospondin type 3 repeat-containing protein [Paludibacter sp.]|nr:thrombospondin type 3 repeat-containing protein [Paludibacter sp.]
MKRKSLLLLGLLSVIFFTNAQTVDSKIAVGLYGGKNEYNGDLGNGVFDFSKTYYGFWGLSVATYLTPSFDLGIQGNMGDYGYSNSTLNFWGHKTEGTLFLHYKLNNGYIFKESAKLSPFIEVGMGLAGYSSGTQGGVSQAGRINTSGPADFIIPVGVGLKYQFNKTLALQYKFVYNFTNHDKRDRSYTNLENDAYAEHSLGIIFSFGAPKDADGDGVPDKLDKCPNTPKGVKVDAFGCPVDTDGDGVADYQDKCPNTPAGVKVDANGCPLDTDGDGVADYLDKCPDTPAGVKVDANGCPFDSDGDGVADYLDKCPDTPAGVQVNAEGCPLDTDGDGVADYLDKCPNTPKGVAVDANGCPLDRDGDGIPDYLDKCPDVPGVAANKGCPEVKAETKKIFAQALQGIQFESSKDVIKKSSYSILNQVVKVLKENPSYNVEINGHTDSQGVAAKNLDLSQRRAEAVKAYLTKNGIDASRLTAKGFGQTMPIADNGTAAGRAKNRRVEFKVNF